MEIVSAGLKLTVSAPRPPDLPSGWEDRHVPLSSAFVGKARSQGHAALYLAAQPRGLSIVKAPGFLVKAPVFLPAACLEHVLLCINLFFLII